MSLLRALILGLVQGATEFLPISSSGHLVIVPFILGWESPTAAFDVAVHVGTLFSVLWVFRSDIAALVRGVLEGSRSHRTLARLLVIGTVPAAVVGAVLGGAIEEVFEKPVLVSLLLVGTGIILLQGEKALARHREPRDLDELRTGDAVAIGFGQALAILPGISRSGTTISTGLLLGIDRVAAARFSFLLSVPIIAGAGATQIPDIASGAGAGLGSVFVGALTGAISGALAIRVLLGVIVRRGLKPFAFYCFFAATVGLLAALARG